MLPAFNLKALAIIIGLLTTIATIAYHYETRQKTIQINDEIYRQGVQQHMQNDGTAVAPMARKFHEFRMP